MPAIQSVEGTIVLTDGSTRQFLITSDGTSQWGATTEQLGDSVDALEDMFYGLANGEHFTTDEDYDDKENDDE